MINFLLQPTRNSVFLGQEEIRMIVCSCNVIREQQIRDAARQGVWAVDEVYAQLGCELNCGKCLPFAEEIIQEQTRAAA